MDTEHLPWPLPTVRVVARDRPASVAVVGAEGTLSYADLWTQIGRWSDLVSGLDAPRASVIALLANDPARIPAAWLGTRAAGLVPLLIDARLSEEDLEHILATARPAAVVDLARRSLLRRGDAPPLTADAGYVTFSSGSQSARKGIIGSAAGLRHFVEWEIATLALDAKPHRVAMLTSPSFDVVLREFLPVLCSGGQLHVPASTVAASPRRVVPWLSQERIEVVHAVPGLATHWAAAGRTADLPSLSWTLFAGEPLYDTHVRDWLAIAPHTRILNLYGPSETTLAKFSHRVGPEPVPGLQPVGRPLPGTVLRRLPLEPTTVDGIGNEPFRIEIGTPHGSLGYLSGAAGRLRRTGGVTTFTTEDRGRLGHQGTLFVEGRLDSLVKRRGIFVDCGRIECTARSFPDVTTACCVQVHADGSGDLVLFVEQPRAAHEQRSEAALRRLLRQQLGRDVPDRLVRLSALPMLPNGKLDRRELLRLAQDVPVSG